MSLSQLYRAERRNWASITKVIFLVALASGFVVEGAAAQPVTIEDRTLSPEKYVEMGLPALDRAWAADDYAVAARVLESLAGRDGALLPRYHSAKSGAVFDRIVSPQNLAIFSDRSVAMQTRFVAAAKMGDPLAHITEIYKAAAQARKIGSGNLIELFGAQLRYCKTLLQLFDESQLPVTANQWRELEKGLAPALFDALSVLTDEHFSVQARTRMAGYCRQTFPAIAPHFTAATQADMLKRLDKLTQSPQVEAFRSTVVSLADELRAARTRSAPSN